MDFPIQKYSVFLHFKLLLKYFLIFFTQYSTFWNYGIFFASFVDEIFIF